MSLAGLRAALAAAITEKNVCVAEKVKHEKELESCERLLTKLKSIDEDTISCSIELNNMIKKLDGAIVVDGKVWGVEEIGARHNKMRDYNIIVRNSISKLVERINHLKNRIEELRKKIAALDAEIASLQAQIAAEEARLAEIARLEAIAAQVMNTGAARTGGGYRGPR